MIPTPISMDSKTLTIEDFFKAGYIISDIVTIKVSPKVILIKMAMLA